MKRRLHLIIYMMLALLVPQTVQGQDNSTLREIYTQAENDYQLGRLEQALDSLQNNITAFHGNLKQSVYRLMALCYLAQDDVAQSEAYASLLLKENPYYTSVQDPIRFEDMIKQLKSGQSATIVTASNQAESLDEVPVPVTLITEEMIEISGARNLKELLMVYVPGMTNVECNEEMNIAMRGVYSSGQEKILIMLNGHRLNSYGTNVARPDFAISLEKIRQIEVLRGPASSLYGGVALTGVINIITKNGTEVDGLQVKGGIGNYGQLKGGALFGKHYLDLDVLVWGNIYKSKGEKFYIPLEKVLGTSRVGGDIILGGYNQRPSYNIGTTLTWKNLHFMYNSAFTKYVAPYSLSYFFSPYTYDKYFLIEGNKPGYANLTNNLELSYNLTLGKLNLTAIINYDNETHSRYQVVADVTPEGWEYFLTPNGTEDQVAMIDGGFQCLRFKEENTGAELKGSYDYKFGDNHQGNLTAGIHYDYFRLIDASNLEGINFDQIIQNYDNSKNLSTGSENSGNAFVQVKHKWNSLILNAGLRFDYKRRMNGEKFYEYSPRIALIYLKPKWSMKLSYAKSFVDAPYFYRYNKLDNFAGGEDMLSEYLNSWQFTVRSNHLVKGLELEGNFFINEATNLVHPEGMQYYNSGSMKNLGVELNATYRHDRLYVLGNATWQHLLESKDYKAIGNQIYNIPDFNANLNVSYRLLDNLRINAGANYYSSQKSTLESPDEYWEPIYTQLDIPSRIICNLGASYTYRQFELNARLYNVMNHGYEQGGTSIGPIRQQGLWTMFELICHL